MVGLLDSIQCRLRANVNKSLLVSKHWCIHVSESIREHCLCVSPYFSAGGLHVLFTLLGWFARWEVSDHTTAILWSVTSRISLKLHIAFLCSSHQDFSLWVSLVSMRCIHTVVLAQPEVERNPILFYQINQISI